MPRPVSVHLGTILLDGISDADWAGDRKTRRSVACGVITADGCHVAAYSRRQEIVALSSGEAEFCGMHTLSTETILLKDLFVWLGFRVVLTASTDSSAARAMAYREGVGRIRHMDV